MIAVGTQTDFAFSSPLVARQSSFLHRERNPSLSTVSALPSRNGSDQSPLTSPTSFICREDVTEKSSTMLPFIKLLSLFPLEHNSGPRLQSPLFSNKSFYSLSQPKLFFFLNTSLTICSKTCILYIVTISIIIYIITRTWLFKKKHNPLVNFLKDN